MTELPRQDNPAEIIWGEVKLRNNSKLLLGGYYRTGSGHAVTQQEEFDRSIQYIMGKCSSKDTVIIGGDFNFRDINWDTESVPPGSYERTASQMLLSTLQKHHLVQMQRETTRESSVLDLYITNRPSLTKEMNTIPNISDHEGAIVVDASITPFKSEKPPRKYFLYSKANWPKMKENISNFSENFLDTANERTVNQNWVIFKNKIHATIDEHVPSRMTSSKARNPWMTQELKRMSRKKAR